MPIKLIPPRQGKSQNWTIRGTHLRVRVDQTTGTPDRKLAAKVLARVRDEIERGVFSRPGAPTFASAALNYVDHGGEERFVLRLAEHFGETPLTQIGQAQIDAAAIALYPHATPATRNRQVYSPVSAILKRAGVEDKLKRPKGGRGQWRPHFLQEKQARALLTGAAGVDAEFGVFLAFLLYTGCRLSDATSLELANLDMSARTAYFPKTKTDIPRVAHLPPPLIAALAGHPKGLDRVGKVFRFRKCGRLYTLLDKAAQAGGVTIPDGVAFHIFRHTYGKWMKDRGADLVGTGAWASEQAARGYAHLSVSEEARKADRLPNVWKWRGK